MTIRDYDTTAGNNTSLSGIGLSDAMLANALDNAIRQLMADSANFLLDIAKPTDSTGTDPAYILTTGGTVTALADNVRLAFRANFTNSGACTINVDSLGAKNIKVASESGIADPVAGNIQSGGVYDIVYVSAISAFVVLNPSKVTDVSQDATPQLGGALDTNGYSVWWSRGADVVSADPLPIGTDGNYAHVTAGAATITKFSSVRQGALVVLRFAAGITLTHNTTYLDLPGSANIVTAAGDMGIFVQANTTGPKWNCIGYMRNDGKPVVSSNTLQVVSSETGAVATGSTVIPDDDTVPQNTEGDQYLSASITPKSATSKLVVEVTFTYSKSTGTDTAIALFRDSTAGAVAVAVDSPAYQTDKLKTVTFTHVETSGSTTATTFKVRAGGSSGAITLNGVSGARKYGGAAISGITITEIE